jgi:hypothetical protein
LVELSSPVTEDPAFFEQTQAHILSLSKAGEMDSLKAMFSLQNHLYDQDTIKIMIPDPKIPTRIEILKEKLVKIFRTRGLTEARKIAQDLHHKDSLPLLKEVLANLSGFLQDVRVDGLLQPDLPKAQEALLKLMT